MRERPPGLVERFGGGVASGSAPVGWPVRAKNTSSSEGWWTSTSSTVTPASSSARTTVVASPAALRTGARSRRPSWLTWTRPATSGSSALAAAASGFAERDLQARAAGLGLQLGRGAAGDHAAVVDDDDPVGELVGLVEVLRRQQQRDAVGDEPSDHLPHAHSAGRIEAGRRLVEEQHRRSRHQARRRGPGAGASRRSTPSGFGRRRRSDRTARAARSRAAFASARRRPLSRPIITRFCRPVRTSSRVASCAVTPMLRCTAAGLADDVVAGDSRRAGVGERERRQDPNRRRLAGAVRSEDAEDRAGGHLQVDPVERHGRAESLRQAVRLDHQSCPSYDLLTGRQVSGRRG